MTRNTVADWPGVAVIRNTVVRIHWSFDTGTGVEVIRNTVSGLLWSGDSVLV